MLSKERQQTATGPGTEQLTYEPFQAYRVRETGNGVVANRETLEEWLDAGNEDYLMLLVDPSTGNSFEDMISDDVGYFAEICEPAGRHKLVKERCDEEVSIALPRNEVVYSPLVHQLA